MPSLSIYLQVWLAIESSRYVITSGTALMKLTVWQLSYPPMGYKDLRTYKAQWQHHLNTRQAAGALSSITGSFGTMNITIGDPRAMPLGHLRDDIKRSLASPPFTDDHRSLLKLKFSVGTVYLVYMNANGNGDWKFIKLTEGTWRNGKDLMSHKYEVEPYLAFGLSLLEEGGRAYEMP